MPESRNQRMMAKCPKCGKSHISVTDAKSVGMRAGARLYICNVCHHTWPMDEAGKRKVLNG